MCISYIKVEFSGETYLPEFDEADWKVVERWDQEGFDFVSYRCRA